MKKFLDKFDNILIILVMIFGGLFVLGIYFIANAFIVYSMYYVLFKAATEYTAFDKIGISILGSACLLFSVRLGLGAIAGLFNDIEEYYSEPAIQPDYFIRNPLQESCIRTVLLTKIEENKHEPDKLFIYLTEYEQKLFELWKNNSY